MLFRSVYLGDRTRVEIATDAGTVVWAELADDEATSLGDGAAVAAGWSTDAARAWRDDETTNDEVTR